MTHTFPHTERLTITLPWAVIQQLRDRSDLEGRSTSNLAAYLIEKALNPWGPGGKPE